ncbi:family 20 glycosylhydrolase [Caulobacter sp. KR2-114]|uniref:family 20 glycosylhydrolase n=1 Tax=Caulobacter sp. KR2-114 TaxID=3400912 RepID=UPI003C06FFDB
MLSPRGWLLGAILIGLTLLGSALAGAAFAAVDIVPAPRAVETPADAAPFRLTAATVIVAPAGDADALSSARELQTLALKSRGLSLPIRPVAPAAAPTVIVFARGGGDEPESYRLDVGGREARITARSAAGLFYGVASLWQLMTPDEGRGPVTIAAVRIDDAPRFAWRGLLLDSARHYQSPAFIEQFIDWMALHKLNVLQWHLTDDQAWRLEIPKYPRLTEVGGWRVGSGADRHVDPATGRPVRYGGIYTAADVRRLVAYAQARGVTIVPEIEMPGHALSAILAYPELGSAGPAPPSIQGDWGVFPTIYNYDDRTFAVLEDVLTEVMALFPSRYINIGGDEAVSDQWKASPQVQARMKAMGVASETVLQGEFLKRIDAFLSAHGRKLVGWDEIVSDGLPPSATVMSWHGVYWALEAARAGHDAVLAPSPILYFDHRQSDLPDEPPGRGAVITLKDVYGFDPAPGRLTDAERRHILGLQANIWTEHIRTEARVAAMAFPRAAAVAEVGWSPAGARAWPGFLQRLPGELARYRALGLNADESALALKATPQADPITGRDQVVLTSLSGVGQIHYTLDGSSPTPVSPAYAAPIAAGAERLRAQAFAGAAPVSRPLDLRLDGAFWQRRVSQTLRACTDKLTLDLEGPAPAAGPRAVMLVDLMNPCWIFPQRDLSAGGVLTVAVGALPFNFQLGADRARIPLRPTRTPEGELEVRDGCAGELVASLPLARAAPRDGVTTLTANLPPRSGRHDLCLQFTARAVDPTWAVDWVRLAPFTDARQDAAR